MPEGLVVKVRAIIAEELKQHKTSLKYDWRHAWSISMYEEVLGDRASARARPRALRACNVLSEPLLARGT